MKNKRYVVNVTAKDISGAKRGNPNHCPIARACRRQGLDRVAVHGNAVIYGRYDKNRMKNCFFLPLKASRFVTRFDFGYKVKPFTFTALDPEKN